MDDFFQQPPMQRTMVALIDYSSVCGNVWSDALLMKMSHRGIPVKWCRWIRAMAVNRLTLVKLNGVRSRTVTLNQLSHSDRSCRRSFSFST